MNVSADQTLSSHTHTHTRTSAPYQCTPEDLMAFRSRPCYYGHPLSTFTVGRLKGMNLLPASFRKFIEALNREMRWMIFSPSFYVSMEHFTVMCSHSILPSLCIWLQLRDQGLLFNLESWRREIKTLKTNKKRG